MEKDQEIVKEVLNSNFCVKWMTQQLSSVAKSTQASENMRKSGNEAFKNKIHDENIHKKAWQCYTSSLTTAEKDSEALALGYGNRSVILFHLSKYKECIKDIDRASAISKDNAFCVKLLLRKVKCLHALNSRVAREIVLEKAESLISEITNAAVKKTLEKNLNKTKEFLQETIKIDIENKLKKVRSLEALMEKHEINDFSSINIQFDEKYGRHLVAAKDLKPGDVIFIEKPQVQCINFTNNHGFCSHCFNVCWANIPCNCCSWAMFCSEKCKMEAWEKYHDIECSVWTDLKQAGDCTPQQLALRIIILALKEYGTLENIQAEMKKIDEYTDIGNGIMQDGKIESDNLKAIFSLSNNISEESLSKIHKEFIVKALKSIGMNTSLFGDNFDHSNADSYKDNETAILFGTLFLRLCKIGQVNGRQIWNHRYYPCPNNPGVVVCPLDKQCCTAGSYIAPVTSLLNHSCWCNARVCYGENNTVIVYATQPIDRGEQIFDCYSFQVHEENLDIRQKIHSYIYNFTCDCIVCELKLPCGLALSQAQLKTVGPAEVALSRRYEGIIRSSVPKIRTNFDENVIKHLSQGIEQAIYEIANQPSAVAICLMFCLQRAYEQIYGISLDVPKTCNKF